MPRWLGRQNAHGVPANALWLSNGMVQLVLVLTLLSKASYVALISLSTAMILIPYLFSAGYGLKLAWQGEGDCPPDVASHHPRLDAPITALGALLLAGIAAWLLWAGRLSL